MKRSASVDFPWSMWAMIEKLRIWRKGWPGKIRRAPGSALGVARREVRRTLRLLAESVEF
jgi:hypothetical protein